MSDPVAERHPHKVLMVAYDFPPARTSGVYRPLKFAKYLTEFGWQPVILTVRNPPKGDRDAGLLEELPKSIRVALVPTMEPVRLEQAVFDAFFRAETAASGPVGDRPEEEGRSPIRLRDGFKRRFLSPLREGIEHLLYVPDPSIGWLPLAVAQGVRIARQEKARVVWATSSPHTSQLVGLWIHRLTGLPLVADFRDPWTDSFSRARHPPRRRNRERRMEAAVLRAAARVVHLSESHMRMSQASFPEIPADRHVVLPNGYDEADFASTTSTTGTPGDVLELLCVGTIYENSSFEPVLDVLAKAFKSDKEFRRSIRIVLIGPEPVHLRDRLSREPLRGAIIHEGFLSHEEAILRMCTTDVHLLTVPAGGPGMVSNIPGKVYELMRSGRPIFFVGWGGESAELVRRTESGVVVNVSEAEEILMAIQTLVERKRAGLLVSATKMGAVMPFSRRALTEQLARVFDTVLEVQMGEQSLLSNRLAG